MRKQKLKDVFDASGLPIDLSDQTDGDLITHPKIRPSAGLAARSQTISRNGKIGPVTLLASEYVTAHLVQLPKSSARQQAQMMGFAVEERIAEPLENVAISKGTAPKHIDGVLVFVTAKDVLDQNSATVGLIPEFLMIPPPQTAHGWAVWREGDRAVVRVGDGTGFAAPISMLSTLWTAAGRPPVDRLAQVLPNALNARDQSDAPPVPLATDLAFRFANDHARQTKSTLRILAGAGGVVVLAALAHLGLLAVDTLAMKQQADQARIQAQAAIQSTLPGIALTSDVTPILARLAPTPTSQRAGDFLPILSDVSRVIAARPSNDAASIRFRRLAWGAQDNQLVLLVEARALDDLQSVQQALQANGFRVTTGAAVAGDGAAESEMRIMRGTP